MVNRPEWNQVAAPDFSVALRALESAGDRFDKGLGAARNGVAGIEAIKNDNVSRAFALQMAKFSDPAELQAALSADPTLGVAQPNRLSVAEINSGDNQVSALLQAASNRTSLQSAQGTLAQTERERGISNTEDDQFRAAAPKVNDYILLARTDQAAAAKMLESDPVLRALPPARLNSLLTGGMSMRGGQLGMQSTENSYDMQVWNDTNTRTDKTDSDQALLIGEQAIGPDGNVLDASEVPGWINENRDRLLGQGFTVRQIAAARGRAMATLQSFGGDEAGGAGGAAGGGGSLGPTGGESGGGGGGGNKNSYDVVYGDTANGNKYDFNPPKPPSQMTMGEVFDYGQNVVKPRTRADGIGKINGKVVGTSAIGKYQIVGTTLAEIAPKVFPGQDWRTIQYSEANQDKLGEYLFEKNKNGNLKATWEGLPSSRAGAYADVSWPVMKTIISKYESNVGGGGGSNTSAGPRLDPRQTGKQIGDNQTGAAVNLVRNPNMAVAADFATAALDIKSTPRQIAAALVKPGGELAGESVGNVAGIITNVMSRGEKSGVSAAVAGRIIARSAGRDKGFGGELWRQLGGGDGLKVELNDEAINQNLAIYADKSLMKSAVSTLNESTSSMADSTAAQAELVKARQAYVARENLARSRGIRNPNMSGVQARLDAAEAAIIKAGGRVQGIDESGNQPGDRGRESPPPPPPPKRNTPTVKAPAPSRSNRGGGMSAQQFNTLLQDYAAGPQSGPAWARRPGNGSLLLKR